MQEHIKGRLFSSGIDFTDGGAAYSRFWNKYKRPPAEEYQQYIIDRRDLLVPQNIREVKGSFFTPHIWVEKSQEYLEKALGVNWQDEYIIWDCAAGTGNLLAGLSNKYNIWASTIDQGDVDTMHALIDEGLNLLHGHVFQFDFLNDKFDKLPEELKEIINDKAKIKKLIIYINPPYAEASSSKTARGQKERLKPGVAINNAVYAEYKDSLGKAGNELFAHFMTRVFAQLKGVHLAVFSKLKYLNSSNFTKFRGWFSAKFQKGFICRADTFDNVTGKFPIGFLIWQLAYNGYEFPFPKTVKLDALDNDGKQIAKKSFFNHQIFINKWIAPLSSRKNNIGILYCTGNDFQQNKLVYISLEPTESHLSAFYIAENNVLDASVYFAVRHSIAATWLNDRDQYYHPSGDEYKKDRTFQHDCLMFMLFHGQNRISAADGINHWIPFSEQEVDAKEKFKSSFMAGFIKDISFSREAKKVLWSGLELWKYYHAKTKPNKTASANASFYDIRAFFQGRGAGGKMNSASTDETYTQIIKTLRADINTLSEKIEPKVYQYGFLK